MSSNSSIRISMLRKNLLNYSLLENLWILDSTSGICLYKKDLSSLTNTTLSDDMICGFFSAISDLTYEIFADDLQYFKLKEKKLFFDFIDDLIIVASVKDSIVSDFSVLDVLKQISDRFLERFDLLDWAGEVDQFDSFEEDLEEILISSLNCPYLN